MLQQGEGRLLQTQVERLVKADAELTAGRLSLAVVSSPPEFDGPPAHRHPRNDEAFFVIEGDFAFLVDDQTVAVGPGGFVFVPAGTVHAFVNRSSSPGKILEMFSPADFEGYFDEIAALRANGSLSRERLQELQDKFGMEVVGPPLARPEGGA